MTAFASTVVAPDYPPRERHPLIFHTFDSLKPGETIQLINDHDPKPLYYIFMMERTDQFSWDYLEAGLETWQVAIRKTK